MTLTLDMRAPTIVLVAHFNPAIFDPSWIARNLFDKQEGDDMSMIEIIAKTGDKLQQLRFFEGVAMVVTPERTDLFGADGKPETLERVEALLLKMLEVLPHTPVAAIGCNFNFMDDTPTEKVAAFFETPELLEGEGELNLRHSGVQLQLADGEVLNFRRSMSAQGAHFSFNYHRPETSSEQYAKFVPGLIARSLEHSKTLLKSYYDYDDPEIVGFLEEAEKKDDSNATESAD